jgi:glucan biosynthesis protein
MAETGHGQWLWRPLGNPRELRVNRFMDDGPRGFGLIQRQRNLARYLDNEEQYQSRPSYWVQPLGNWGKGGVELVEIPSDEEIHVLQFTGGDLDGLDGVQPVKAEASADNGKLEALTVQRIPALNVWEVAFVVAPRVPKKPVDMKCFLSLYGEVLTETWVYQWTQ